MKPANDWMAPGREARRHREIQMETQRDRVRDTHTETGTQKQWPGDRQEQGDRHGETDTETRTPREIDRDTRDRTQREAGTETHPENPKKTGGSDPETGSWRMRPGTEKGHWGP